MPYSKNINLALEMGFDQFTILLTENKNYMFQDSTEAGPVISTWSRQGRSV
jgi:hypothetical protein